ncbi:MAG: bifunctional UDP-N-acetylglucosamine diphosphorylase/glucosamine-1-phosphate N-acetyltransferase GlmU [Leptospirillia bacterium]
MSGERFRTVVLAAGKGTRMKSAHPKVLHPVCGQPMVRHVVACAQDAGGGQVIVVVGHGAEAVSDHVLGMGGDARVVEQAEQLGTGHAVLACHEALEGYDGPVLILSGDVPLVTQTLVEGLTAAHTDAGGGLTLLTVELETPDGYGRVIRDGEGRVTRIVEQKDANADELAVREVNTGIYVVDAPVLFAALSRVSCDNAQGEYYLTDIVSEALSEGVQVNVYRTDNPSEVLGVNSRSDLARVSAVMRRRIAEDLMAAGVTLISPEQTYVDAGVSVGADTVLYPGVTLEGNTVIGRDCTVRSGCRIADSRLGDGIEVKDNSLITGAVLEGGNQVGPNAHLRPGAHLMRDARVGNFVEIKKAVIGTGSKVNHLSYVGDAEVGEGVNIGAGTITCNYDGVNKHKTVIGDGVFIGSDTQLVAPVRVGAGATIAAGTTVTSDVPEGALAISRVEQQNKADWASRKADKQAGS